MKKIIVSIFICILAIIFVACGNNQDKEQKSEETPLVTEEEKMDHHQVVAIVNGDEIKGSVYNLVYSQLKLHSVQIGKELESEEIQEATMDSIIDRQILIQQAREKGITITEEKASAELERLKVENEKSFSTLLEQYQITEEEFKDQLVFELTMNEFMKQEIQVTVSDEEVEEYYEKAKEGNDNIPAFDDIKASLERQIEHQKVQEELQKEIDKVRNTAEIEVKI